MNIPVKSPTKSPSEAREVRIVQLEPQRVASALGFGMRPEALAWDKLLNWAREKGLVAKQDVRFFGFNNPSPSPGSPNYGYEQWMTVGPEVQGNEEITIKEYPGGRYAVTSCQLREIEATWKALMAWCEASSYRWVPNQHQWLEEAITRPGERDFSTLEMYLDLYMPIAG